MFSTAETVAAGFADPAVASSAEPAARGQERLWPLFTALVREVLDAAFAESAKLGGPLEPGLLVVLDEAANVAPLAELDGIAAPGSLRRLPRGEAVLLYGTLPPARVRLPAPEPERRLSRPSTRFSYPGRFQRPRLLHPGWDRKRRG